MSVTNQTPVNAFTANGATTVFNFTFQLLDSSDLLVHVDGTAKIIGAEYTVSGIGNPAGGSITFISAPTNGSSVVMSRSSVMERSTDYQNNGDLRAATINSDLDRIWLSLQEILYKYQLSPTMPKGSPLAGNVSLPSPGAGKFIRWNLTGDDLEAVDGTGTVPGDFIQSGTGAVSRSIQSKIGEVVSAEDFGAVGNYITNDSAAIMAGVNALSVGPLHLPKGPYAFALTIPANKGVMSYTEGASKDVWYWGRNMSGAKSTGAGSANLGYGPAGFLFDLRNDSADCGADFMRALYGRTVFGGSTVKGGRIGVLGEVIHQLGATNSANANRNYVGLVCTAHSENGDGGSDSTTNAKGAYFGLNGIGRAAAGATNILEVAGCELNTYVGAGSSMRYLFGATIAGFNMVHGSEIEAALEIGGGTDSGYGPHVGWNNGILFSNIHGSDPTNANTTLIGAYFQGGGGLRNIKAGLDTSLFNCSSGIVLGPNLVLTDNALNLGVNGANISAIKAGNNATAANLDLMPKGGGAIRLYDAISGTIRLYIDNGNGIRMVPMASATPQANGELAVQATSNTSLTFKFKGSDGTVRSASLALA